MFTPNTRPACWLHQSDGQEASHAFSPAIALNISRELQRCEQPVNGHSWVLQVNVKTVIDSRAESSSFIFTSLESLIDGGCLCFIRSETKCGEGAGRATPRRHSVSLPQGLVQGSVARGGHRCPRRDPLSWSEKEKRVTRQ